MFLDHWRLETSSTSGDALNWRLDTSGLYIGFVKEHSVIDSVKFFACNRSCCFTARCWTSRLRFGAHPPPPPLT
jgi:hypothetical protein